MHILVSSRTKLREYRIVGKVKPAQNGSLQVALSESIIHPQYYQKNSAESFMVDPRVLSSISHRPTSGTLSELEHLEFETGGASPDSLCETNGFGAKDRRPHSKPGGLEVFHNRFLSSCVVSHQSHLALIVDHRIYDTY